MWSQTNETFKVILKVLITFFVINTSNAQILEAPTIGNSAPGNCYALGSSGQFEFNFVAPSGLPLSTEYTLELSNIDGSFSTNTIILDRGTADASLDVLFSFDYPATHPNGDRLGSEKYKARVIVENQNTFPAGRASGEFFAYYYDASSILALEPREICTLQALGSVELRAENDFDNYI